MLAEILAICSILCFIGLFLNKKKKGQQSPRDVPTETDYGETRTDPVGSAKNVEVRKPRQSYEEEERNICSRHGKLPCDGTRCTPYIRCSPVERLFCRDVLTKAVEGNFFSGQYTLPLPSGNCRLDFAVGTKDGRRLAIEFDGFHAHARELDPDAFNRQLRRQNELILAGWQVLRFSYYQLIQETEWCRQVLQAALAPAKKSVAVPLCGPLARAEVHGCADTEAAKRCGLVFSDLRQCWYVNNLNEVAPSTPEDWRMNVWAACPNSGCAGRLEVRQRRDDKRYFWYCPVCDETFSDRSGGQRRTGPVPKNRSGYEKNPQCGKRV